MVNMLLAYNTPGTDKTHFDIKLKLNLAYHICKGVAIR